MFLMTKATFLVMLVGLVAELWVLQSMRKYTPLMYASEARGELDKVKCLVKCKADANAPDPVKQQAAVPLPLLIGTTGVVWRLNCDCAEL